MRQRRFRFGVWAFRLFILNWWFVTLPVIAFLSGDWLVFFAVSLVCYGIRRWQRARSGALDSVELEGEDVRTLYESLTKNWRRHAFELGLVRRRSELEGVGPRRTYLESMQGHEAMLNRRAYGADTDDYLFPLVVGVQQSRLGLDVEVELVVGQTMGDFEEAAEALRNAYEVREVRVSQELPRCVRLSFVTRDPLSQGSVVQVQALPEASTEAVTVGTMEDGSPMRFRLDQTNSVVGGIPGGGKSVSLNVLLAGLAQLPEVQVVGIDCKGGIEFDDWNPRLSAYGMDQESAFEVLQKVDALGKARLESLRGSGYRSQSRRGYSSSDPMFVVVIDECSELFIPEGSSKEAKALANDLMVLVSRGVRLYRAAGIFYVLATQKPTTDVLPSIIRDNCANRVSFKCTTQEQATAILGPDVRGAELSPVRISDKQKGYCVLGDDAGRLAMGMSMNIQEQDCADIARMYEALATPLDLFLLVETEDEESSYAL